MKTVHLCKADPTGPQTIPDTTIVIAQPLAHGDATLNEHRVFYDEQAKVIVDALAGALPGGTMHAILVRLLQRQAYLYRVLDDPAPARPTPAPEPR